MAGEWRFSRGLLERGLCLREQRAYLARVTMAAAFWGSSYRLASTPVALGVATALVAVLDGAVDDPICMLDR